MLCTIKMRRVSGVALSAALAMGCGGGFDACEDDACEQGADSEQGADAGVTPGSGGSGGAAGSMGATDDDSDAVAGPNGAGATDADGADSEDTGSGGNEGDEGDAAEGSGGAGGSASSPGDGGTSGGTSPAESTTDGSDAAVECNPTSSPYDDACVISDVFGVFVSPTGGDDTGDGSREKPYRTLTVAAQEAASQGKRVYACATDGPYEEPLVLGSNEDGVELFGALDCDDWSASQALRASVTPENGPALLIEDVSDGVLIEGFGFVSANAGEPGASSVAGFVKDSENVVLARVTLTAGDGANGEAGITDAVGFPQQSELDGNEGTESTGGAAVLVECDAGGTSVGGAGADPALANAEPGLPDYDGAGGEPGGEGKCTAAGDGVDGASAPASQSGSGATSYGTLTALGWSPSAGAPGAAGLPGQGGGGGRSHNAYGGGSGAAGGCGGAGGASGQGGGASIALLLYNAPVTLVDAELVSARGGNGGAGDEGQPGQQQGGTAVSELEGGCPGGDGGLGGDGGHGGGGAGGVSVGILAQGAAPTLDNTTLEPGSAGTGGLGGDPGSNDGIDGVAEAKLEL